MSVREAMTHLFAMQNPAVGSVQEWSLEVERAGVPPLGTVLIINSSTAGPLGGVQELRGAFKC